ncbi:Hypothetical protein ORPV_900 [Orpheovirus IHUMI-LCC2]|uniref:F-box domain-containing protein n=1 Tax=Orpheovirus IHUMI-LCC2 TaxID=2023057 RepID=A0A2I2L5J2_9VIRU|nr:Hypothetical protein ORPV_900 [Orpheovirus IHUMI-LCC2]SNW62804.1 Hypothetical protein ORPV_900 [Orpheovirus IHUMI-LCC2]
MDVDYLNSLPREILYDIIKKSEPDDILKLCSVGNNELCDYVKDILISEYIGDFGFLMELSNLELSKLINILYPDNEFLEKIKNKLLKVIFADIQNIDYGTRNSLISVINRAIDLDIDIKNIIKDLKYNTSTYTIISNHILSRGKEMESSTLNNYDNIASYLVYDGNPNWLYNKFIAKRGNDIKVDANVDNYDDYYYKLAWIKINILSSTYFYIDMLYNYHYPKVFFDKFKDYIMINCPRSFNIGYDLPVDKVIDYVKTLFSNIDYSKIKSHGNIYRYMDEPDSIPSKILEYRYLLMGYTLRDDSDTNTIIQLIKHIPDQVYKTVKEYKEIFPYPIPINFLYNIINIPVCQYIYNLSGKQDVDCRLTSDLAVYLLSPYVNFSYMDYDIIKSININISRSDITSLKNTINNFISQLTN